VNVIDANSADSVFLQQALTRMMEQRETSQDQDDEEEEDDGDESKVEEELPQLTDEVQREFEKLRGYFAGLNVKTMGEFFALEPMDVLRVLVKNWTQEKRDDQEHGTQSTDVERES
jgi:hypothetical protein